MALFLLALMLLLSTPFVQSRLARYATDYLNETFGININVKKLDLSLLGSVQLKEIEIRDHHKDTLIFVQKLKTSLLNVKKIVDNKLNLGEASLNGVYVHVKTYKGEKDDSMSIFADSFDDGKPRDSLYTPFILRASAINFEDLHFKLINKNKKDSLEFSVTEGGGKVNSFFVVGPDVFAGIKNMYFTDNRKIKVTNLTTDFTYTKKYMLFKNTVLQTNNQTHLASDIKFTYDRKDLADFNDKVQIKARFKKSKIAVRDLSKVYSELRGNDILRFTGVVDGTLNNFSATKVNLNSKNGMKIIGDMGFVNVLNLKRGFIFDADLDNVTSNYYQLKSVLPNLLGKTLPRELNRLGNFTMSGLTKITPDQIDATLTVNSDIGNIISDLQLTDIENIDNASYEGEVIFQDFDVGIFANDSIVGKMSMTADVNGSGFDVENINTTLIGKVSSLEFNGYEYNELSVNGQFQNKKFDGFLSAEDENFQLNFEGLADFSSEVNKFDFNADVSKLDLKKTHLFTRDSVSQLKGQINLNLSGNTFDDIVGKATFKNLLYTNQKETYAFKKFHINSTMKDSIKTIEIDSKDIVTGKLKGKFLFAELPAVAQNALGSIYTNYEPFKVTPNQFLDFNFTIYNQIVDIFLPSMSIGKNTSLKGKINSDVNSLKLTFSSPKVAVNSNILDKVLLRMDNKNKLYNTHLTVGKVDTKYYDIEKLNLLNRTQKDTLFFKSEFEGGRKNKQKFNLDFYYTINKDRKWVLGVQKSMLNYQGFDWMINPEDNKDNKVTFSLKEKDFLISPLTLVSDEQKIEVKGKVDKSGDKDLLANFTKVKLQSFLPEIDSLRLNGKVNGSISVKQEKDYVSPKAKLWVKDFKINGFDQGNLSLNVAGDNSYDKFNVTMELANRNADQILANGIFDFTEERPTTDLQLFIKNYEIAAFSPLGEDVLSRLRGKVTGNFTAKGYVRNPDFDGILSLKDAGLYFPYLNIDFDIKGNTNIRLDKQRFVFDEVTLEDTKYKTQGALSGEIVHQNFEMWFMDLDIDANNLLVLDTEENEEVPYYGTGFLKGTAEITGLTNNLDILVEGKTQPGTTFVIPLSDVKTIDNYKLIHFGRRKSAEAEKEKLIEDIKGLDLKMSLEVTKDAVAQVVIDKVSGSELMGSGQGNLDIDINTRGKFQMVGDFKVDNGVYNFRYAGITKPFKVQKGGTISWSGNPYNAELDLTAVYRTKANPAQLLDNINSSRKIPVDLYTKITGGLFDSKQEFDIKIPNANAAITSELDFILNDNDLNKKMQHFSFLLAFGTFYNENIGVSAGNGITGTASEIAAGILSNMINSKDDKFHLGVGYSQGNNNGDLGSFNTDNQVDVSVSTQLSDRVLVNGKVGVPVGQNTQSSVVGEVKVEVLLNEEGSLRATAFNRQSNVQFQEDEGDTQGIGISYQVNFNNLKDLRKKLGLKKEKTIKKDTLVVKKKKSKMIHFKSSKDVVKNK